MDERLNSKSLKILMVAPQPFFRARGTPFSVLHRIRALCSAGYAVDLVTYPFGEDVDIEGLTIIRASRPPLVKDVKIGPSIAKLALDLPVYLKTRQLLKKNRYDFIHSHEEAAFFCVRLSKKYNLPHVYDMHSSLPQQLDTFGSYNLSAIRNVFRRLEEYVLSSCDGVITICPDLAETAKPISGSTPHAMIENTADDRQAFTKLDLNVRKELSIEDKFIVLYTGTFESYQGLGILMDAMAILARSRPNVHLVMVGGQDAQVQAYKKQAEEAGISDRISFTGTIPPSEIPSYHEAANLIVSPRSSGTNSPLKLYGYMRSGRPIVATDMFTHTQVLDDSVALLVPPTAEGLSDGIARLVDDPDLAASLAAAALERSNSEFADSAYINKVIGFYDDVIAYCSSRAVSPASREFG